MNKLETAQAIAVMQAFIDGKPCRYRPRNSYLTKGGWFSLAEAGSPQWNWDLVEYQVVPETIQYRRAFMNNNGWKYIYVAHKNNSIIHVEQSPYFVRWIDTDWIEETV